MLLLAYEPGAEAVDTLARHPDVEYFIGQMTRGTMSRSSPSPLPFGAAPSVVGDGSRIYVAEGRDFEVVEHDPTAQGTRIFRHPGERAFVTEAHRAAFLEHLFRIPPPDYIRDMLSAAPFPERAAAFDRVLAAPGGVVWTRHFALPDAVEHTWSVFAPEGRWLGVVTTPAELEVMDVAYGRLAGVRLDELDVPYVEVYRVEGW
jgi:hypothetical protein